MRTSATLLLVFTTMTFSPARFAAADDERPVDGEAYTVIQWVADVRLGGDVIGKVQLADRLLVTETVNGWLWVAARKGWVHGSDAVASVEAAQHFDRIVADKPSAESFHQRAIFRIRQNKLKPAVADLQEAHRHNAKNLAVLNDLGNLHRRLGQLEKALGDFDELLRLGAKHPATYTNRGLVHQAAGRHEQALDDFNAALQLDEKFAPAWEAGGSSRYATGDYRRARENFQQAIRLHPEFVLAHNNLAWLLATCPDPDIRDGEAAVIAAERACELTDFKIVRFLDTLAAAHAEAGDFEKAVKRATQAIKLADDDSRTAIEARLALYSSRKPFRQTAARVKPPSAASGK